MRDTMVLLTAVSDGDELGSRIASLPALSSGPFFAYFSCAGLTVGIDGDTESVLGDYEVEELSEVRARIGDFGATLVEYENSAGRDAFLEYVLPGLSGIVDTNYGELVSFGECLRWLARNPQRHFREGVKA